ncbi:MAG: helix-hairpin-helix domain-containing protein, partial [Planctomycetaceae bacterium]
MNPANVRRKTTVRLTDLPNVGPAMARDLERIGIRRPADLAGRDPLDLYDKLCSVTRARHDPCVLDVFMSVTRFIDGGRA